MEPSDLDLHRERGKPKEGSGQGSSSRSRSEGSQFPPPPQVTFIGGNPGKGQQPSGWVNAYHNLEWARHILKLASGFEFPNTAYALPSSPQPVFDFISLEMSQTNSLFYRLQIRKGL
jgi:hypothetical protein